MPEEQVSVQLDELGNLDERIEEAEKHVDEEESDIDTDSEEESEEHELDEEEESEEESDDDSQEDEEVGFDDWVTQYGNKPDGIKNEDDLAKAYFASLEEMKRLQSSNHQIEQLDQKLRQSGFANGVQGLLNGETPQRVDVSQKQIDPPAINKSYFTNKPVSGYIDNLVQSGMLSGEEAEKVRGTASTIDSAIGPEFEKFEKVYSIMANNLTNLTKTVRDLQWGALPSDLRGKVHRQQVDGLLDRGLFEDYESAIKYTLFNSPNSLKDLTEKAEQRGEQKGRKRLRKRSLRKGKSNAPVQKSKFNYNQYMDSNGEWDNRKLQKLSPDDRIKMIETFAKENKIEV